MPRIYFPAQDILADQIVISDIDKIHYLKDVLRLNAGDKIAVFDNQGNEYLTDIEKITAKAITLKIKDRNRVSQKKIRLSVACAIPKKSKMDDIVDKLTQLGVDRVIPLETERVIVKLDKGKKNERQRRWEKIALSASQQSQRNTIPLIDGIKDIREVLSEAGGFDLKLIPTLLGEQKSLKEIFNQSKPKNILVLIGPEGDFTTEEVNLAKKTGCIPVSLGDLVLRVETAAVAVASYIILDLR